MKMVNMKMIYVLLIMVVTGAQVRGSEGTLGLAKMLGLGSMSDLENAWRRPLSQDLSAAIFAAQRGTARPTSEFAPAFVPSPKKPTKHKYAISAAAAGSFLNLPPIDPTTLEPLPSPKKPVLSSVEGPVLSSVEGPVLPVRRSLGEDGSPVEGQQPAATSAAAAAVAPLGQVAGQDGFNAFSKLTAAPVAVPAKSIEARIAKAFEIGSPGLALRFAVRAQRPDLIEECITRKIYPEININEQDKTGTTALMEAVRLGNPRVVRKLLFHDADIGIADRQGQTALEMARKLGNQEITTTLEEIRTARSSDFQNNKAGAMNASMMKMAVENGGDFFYSKLGISEEDRNNAETEKFVAWLRQNGAFNGENPGGTVLMDFGDRSEEQRIAYVAGFIEQDMQDLVEEILKRKLISPLNIYEGQTLIAFARTQGKQEMVAILEQYLPQPGSTAAAAFPAEPKKEAVAAASLATAHPADAGQADFKKAHVKAAFEGNQESNVFVFSKLPLEVRASAVKVYIQQNDLSRVALTKALLEQELISPSTIVEGETLYDCARKDHGDGQDRTQFIALFEKHMKHMTPEQIAAATKKRSPKSEAVTAAAAASFLNGVETSRGKKGKGDTKSKQDKITEQDFS